MQAIEVALLHFCEWCNASFFGTGIRDSVWLFPFVEIFHLLALAVLGACVIIINLSLVRVGFRGDRTPVLRQELRPWIIWTLVVMLVSGFLLFSTEAVKCYGNWAFQLKMLFLLLAAVFTFVVQLRVAKQEDPSSGVRWSVAVVSTLLWLGVGLGGRAIGYVTTAVTAANP